MNHVHACRLSFMLFALMIWSGSSAAQTGVVSGTVVGATSSSGIPSAQGAFTGTTQAQYLAELIDQRRRELFLEGQHLGDIIRYGIVLQPAAGTPYHFGGTYGNQICFPLPSAEKLNNPLIGG